MTKRPTVDAAWASVLAEFDAARSADPLIDEAIRVANGAERGPTRNQHFAFAASRIAPLAPSLPESEWMSLLRKTSVGAEAEVRATLVPGIVGRAVWAIRDGADVDAIRDYIEPGQVWVRADLVKADQWPLVRAQAMDAKERTIGVPPPSGRKPGALNRARQDVVDAVRTDPMMTDDAIDKLGRKAIGWIDARGDYDLRRKRIAAIRRDSAKV